MAERDAPTTPRPDNAPELRTHDPNLSFRPGTYVVQVPKDLVYRVPPPENALIVERHRNNNHNWKPCGCCSCVVCCFISVVVVVLGVGLVVGVSLFLIQSKDPGFHVKHIMSSVNREKSWGTTYDVKLKVDNPNGNAGILYGEGGVAWLWFREEKIGSGTFPSFFQKNGKSTEVEIILGVDESEDGVNSEKIQIRSKKSTSVVALSLEMEVPATVKKGIFSSGKLKFGVRCDVVVDNLGKSNRILSEGCETTRHA